MKKLTLKDYPFIKYSMLFAICFIPIIIFIEILLIMADLNNIKPYREQVAEDFQKKLRKLDEKKETFQRKEKSRKSNA